MSGVDLLHSVYDLAIAASLYGSGHKGLHILGKAGPPIPDTRINKVVADPLIRAYPLSNHSDIGSHSLADICHLVHKGYLGRQHGIRSVFGHLGAADIHNDQLLPVSGKRSIELLDELRGPNVVRSQNDPVWLHEVVDGISLL